MKNHLLSLTCLAVALLGHNVSAIQVQFDFSGLVTDVQPGRFGSSLGCAVGQSYDVSLLYDSMVPDKDASSEAGYFNSGYGFGTGPTMTAITSLGGHVYRGGYAGSSIRQIWTGNAAEDSFKVEIEGPAGESWCTFLLTDTTGSTLASDALPETAFSASDWDQGSFEWLDASGTKIFGSILGLRQPIPDSGPFMALALIGLVVAHLWDLRERLDGRPKFR